MTCARMISLKINFSFGLFGRQGIFGEKSLTAYQGVLCNVALVLCKAGLLKCFVSTVISLNQIKISIVKRPVL